MERGRSCGGVWGKGVKERKKRKSRVRDGRATRKLVIPICKYVPKRYPTAAMKAKMQTPSPIMKSPFPMPQTLPYCPSPIPFSYRWGN